MKIQHFLPKSTTELVVSPPPSALRDGHMLEASRSKLTDVQTRRRSCEKQQRRHPRLPAEPANCCSRQKGQEKEKKERKGRKHTHKNSASHKPDPLAHAWPSAGARASHTYTLRLAGHAEACTGAPRGSYGK